MEELPFQTYERMFGVSWPGGKSSIIIDLLKLFNIHWEPGSAEANLALQGALLSRSN